MRDQLDHLSAQWQEQPRLRAAGWVILALLVAHLVALSADWQESRRHDVMEAGKSLAKMQALAKQDYWPTHAIQAEDALAKLRSQLWQARNPALARADVQAWLDTEIRKAELLEARVNVLPPLGFEEGQRDARIEAQVRGRFDAVSFGRLLSALESAPRWVSIDALEISNRVSPSINMQLSFHFLAQDQ
ncbi:hypothetical protein JFY56_05120 [Pseudomonas sp. Milli4]|uniref:Uncharacterized protein n=2 Tax=Pseudomonas schmalbachii TaxID=2816993 RepID=A0ABS3TLS4_9PSED|nr:hypothetical protein [Pseudomonas schmalbachii]